MFGYVRPKKSELLVRQAEYYRAAYCGLCRSMRREGGALTSFSLSYDFALLTVMRTAVIHELPVIEAKRCPVHPLKKRPSFKENASTRYCAAAAILLTYRNLCDDVRDEKGLKKLASRLIMPVFKRGRKRILRRHPELSELDSRLSEILSRLSDAENERVESADIPGGIFGELLGEICAFGLENAHKKTAYSFGKAIGHWIYLVDAADDLESDAQKDEYNPIIALYGKELSDSDRNWLSNALIARLMEAEAAFDLMDMGDDPDAIGIIKNTLYLGLPSVAGQVLSGSGDVKKEGVCRRCGACRSKS